MLHGRVHIWISYITWMSRFIRRIWMSHVRHMNQSLHTYEWVTMHIWIINVTHPNESCHTVDKHAKPWHTYGWVMTHMCMSHVRIWMSHVAHMNESCHTDETHRANMPLKSIETLPYVGVPGMKDSFNHSCMPLKSIETLPYVGPIWHIWVHIWINHSITHAPHMNDSFNHLCIRQCLHWFEGHVCSDSFIWQWLHRYDVHHTRMNESCLTYLRVTHAHITTRMNESCLTYLWVTHTHISTSHTHTNINESHTHR